MKNSTSGSIHRSNAGLRAVSNQTGALLSVAMLTTAGLYAEETNTVSATASASVTNSVPAETKAEKGAPLPLHQIEGNGGIFATLSAYIVNPPRNGEWLGRPSVGIGYVHVGHERNLEAITITESPWKRLELGYGFDNFGLGDLPQDVAKATGGAVQLRDDNVQLHNYNARLQLLKEGELDTKWIPAVTLGVHYKKNEGIKRINDDLGGALVANGIESDTGTDFTLYGSKMLTFLPRPVLINLGGRATQGAHLGLLGFTKDYEYVFEGNVVVFVTDSLALAAEYKQKPNAYKSIGNLVKPEDDWWTLDAAYVVNKHFTVAAGYGHFGNVLNHSANGVWGITTKYEF